ncbi:MAG: ABC transporter ATP-binding protein [Hydrogenophilaceae bacterium]|nr:ABC transporter ATP-binding protein [Hydrogenophilaceae bacterium]
MPHIRLKRVSFSYPVFEMTGRSLKVAVMRQVAGATISSGPGYVRVDALKEVSLELQPGDRLGLIGHNGAGKSSLLRVLAGLAHPTGGELDIQGRVIALIEKGMGINPELSGMANIELPLRLLGATSKEVEAAKREIPEWTGLGQFIDMPFRTYSEGMKARLSFALSTAVPGDILLLDEWLGAGDAAFIEQAQKRLTAYLDKTEIVVLASHSLDLISNVCNIVAWFERGRLLMMGNPWTVINAYLNASASGMAAE